MFNLVQINDRIDITAEGIDFTIDPSYIVSSSGTAVPVFNIEAEGYSWDVTYSGTYIVNVKLIPNAGNFGTLRNSYPITYNWGAHQCLIDFEASFTASTHLQGTVSLIHTNSYAPGGIQEDSIISSGRYIYLAKGVSVGTTRTMSIVEYNVATGETNEIELLVAQDIAPAAGTTRMAVIQDRIILVGDYYLSEDYTGDNNRKFLIVNFANNTVTETLIVAEYQGDPIIDPHGGGHSWQYEYDWNNLCVFTDAVGTIHMVIDFKYTDWSQDVPFGKMVYHATYPDCSWTAYTLLRNYGSYEYEDLAYNYVIVANRYVAYPGFYPINNTPDSYGHISYVFDSADNSFINWNGDSWGYPPLRTLGQVIQAADSNGYFAECIYPNDNGNLKRVDPTDGQIANISAESVWLLASKDGAYYWSDSGIYGIPVPAQYSSVAKPANEDDACMIMDDDGTFWYMDGTNLIGKDADGNVVKQVDTGISGYYRGIVHMGSTFVIFTINSDKTQVNYYLVK